VGGNWVCGLELPRVPPDVVGHLKMFLLDSLGLGLFGAGQRWGVIAGDVAVAFSNGGVSSLFARPERVSPADVALANGTAIHGFEIDDAHLASSLHPGAVTVPAGLAIAEAHAASGEEFLTALAAGYEVGIRVGICAGLSHSTSGYHVTAPPGIRRNPGILARLRSFAYNILRFNQSDSIAQDRYAAALGGLEALSDMNHYKER
jgi:aconitate decarboxylase